MSRSTFGSEDTDMAGFLGGIIKIDGREVLEYVSKNFSPSDVFDEKELRAWAYDNDMQDV